jgi:hypothetical protein
MRCTLPSGDTGRLYEDLARLNFRTLFGARNTRSAIAAFV